MNKIKNILIIGPQGSGKDTQSERLAQKRKIPFIVMGDLFRREIKSRSQIGLKVVKLMNQGILASDNLTFSLLKKRLSKNDVKKGYILNGFPRNLKQAKMLEKITSIDLAIELWISDKESLRRLSGRRFCPACKTTYHVIYKKTKKKNICDRCQAELIIREDDKVAVIKKRLGIYHKQTEPVFKFYRKKTKVLRINGEQPIRRVFSDLVRKIKTVS